MRGKSYAERFSVAPSLRLTENRLDVTLSTLNGYTNKFHLHSKTALGKDFTERDKGHKPKYLITANLASKD